MANCLMVAVDPDEDSMQRHVVRHYAYDPERRERRHQVVAAFSTAKEAEALLRRLSEDWRRRRADGEAPDAREHFSAVVWQPGYRRLQSNARLLKAALRRGVSIDRLQDLDLPPNVTLLRSRAKLPLLRRLWDRVVKGHRNMP